MKKLSRFIMGCVCLGFAMAVTADSHMNFVISASRYASVYPNSTIITEENIQQFKDFTIGDVLQGEPGVQANRYGGKGGVNALSLQGANSNQTLILLDGIPLKNAVYGSVDLNNINLDQIQNIELYRGGMSAIYGADAVGGVINLVSSKKLNTRNLKLETGTYGNQNISLEWSQGTKLSNCRLSVFHGRYDGYQPIGYFHNDNFLLEYNETLGRDLSVRLRGSAYVGQRGNPAGPYSASEQEDRGYMALTQIVQTNEDSEVGKLYFMTKSDERKAISGFVTDSKGWINTLGGFREINLGSHFLHLGLETNQMIPKDATLTKNISVQNNAGFMNDDWSVLPWWRVNAGFRRDMHSTFGVADTYKLSSSFLLGNECTVKTSYGTSFRSPSIADLYYQDAWGSAGNPNLRPETARNFDLELAVKTPAGVFRSSYFEKKITDLIEWISAADWSSSSPNNVGRARLSGIETEWSGVLTETILYNVNWVQMLDASDETSGNWLQYRARTKINVGLHMNFPAGNVALRMNYISERTTSTGGAGSLPRYYVVDMDYTKDNFSLFMHNVFNRQYQEYSGYDMPGRTMGVKVSLSF